MRRIICLLLGVLLLVSLTACETTEDAAVSPEPSDTTPGFPVTQPIPDCEPWTMADVYAMVEAFYQDHSENLTAFANAFSETGESQLHIRMSLYAENPDELQAVDDALPEPLRQPFVDCFSDYLVDEWRDIEIDFYDVKAFLEHPEFDRKTGFPKEYFRENPKQDPTEDAAFHLSGLSGVVGYISIMRGHDEAYETGTLYLTYYEDPNDFAAQIDGANDTAHLLDEHWFLNADTYIYWGL